MARFVINAWHHTISMEFHVLPVHKNVLLVFHLSLVLVVRVDTFWNLMIRNSRLEDVDHAQPCTSARSAGVLKVNVLFVWMGMSFWD